MHIFIRFFIGTNILTLLNTYSIAKTSSVPHIMNDIGVVHFIGQLKRGSCIFPLHEAKLNIKTDDTATHFISYSST